MELAQGPSPTVQAFITFGVIEKDFTIIIDNAMKSLGDFFLEIKFVIVIKSKDIHIHYIGRQNDWPVFY